MDCEMLLEFAMSDLRSEALIICEIRASKSGALARLGKTPALLPGPSPGGKHGLLIASTAAAPVEHSPGRATPA